MYTFYQYNGFYKYTSPFEELTKEYNGDLIFPLETIDDGMDLLMRRMIMRYSLTQSVTSIVQVFAMTTALDIVETHFL